MKYILDSAIEALKSKSKYIFILYSVGKVIFKELKDKAP